MAQTFTLDEAAQRLALSPEEFKRRYRTDWKHLKSFRDGPTLRFRSADIDELARGLGEASAPALQLGPVGTPPADDSDDFELTADVPAPSGRSKPARPDPRMPVAGVDEPFVVPPTGSAINKSRAAAAGGSDSDVRLDPAGGTDRPADDASLFQAEEVTVDLPGGPGSAIIKPTSSGKVAQPRSGNKLTGPPSGKFAGPLSSKIPGPVSGKLSGPASGKFAGPPSAKIPGPASGRLNPDGSSEFELSLDADSDSFELNLTGDGSDEVDIGGLAPPAPSGRGGLSGINLGRPADSGLSLEKPGPRGGGLAAGGPRSTPPKSAGAKPPAAKAPPSGGVLDSDFELSVDPLGGPASSGLKPRPGEPDDSEFELTLDDSGDMGPVTASLSKPRASGSSPGAARNDIFETDFDIPSVSDGSDEAAALDEATSDFDLAINDADAPLEDESASQVVLVDDMPLLDEDGVVTSDLGDEVAVDDVEVEEGPSASSSLAGVRRGVDDDDDDRPARVVAAAPARWGALPAVVLLPTLLFAFVGALTSFELLQGMWGYHQSSKPSGMLVRGLANTFGIKVSD